MYRIRGTFNTDQVNRDRMICPASELMRAEERHQRNCVGRSTKPGMPSNIQHDMHRLFGWALPLGLYIDGRMVRALGAIDKPETDQEQVDLKNLGDAYWKAFHDEGIGPVKEELIKRLGSVNLEQADYFQLEAAAVARIGITAELYPEFFKHDSDHVDRDGLVDYRELLKRTKQVQPGVFHDSKRNLLLFAHRFFRRSLSHRNSLNVHFLRTFDTTANDVKIRNVRLRLDPDIIGYPESARAVIELEHWRGPLFNDDVAAIPDGVAEHKANDRTRFYEGIDRTQVWWKAPESRQLEDGADAAYRTFEVEELVENPSGGLPKHNFGCRYAHAEYSLKDAAISHFDGAIRGYAGEAYLDRIDTSIDRAGKHANYTKLFRFDGELQIAAWKRALCDFFRGNPLISEYFNELVSAELAETPAETKDQELELAALISLAPGSIADAVNLTADHFLQIADERIPFVEIGSGEVANYLRTRFAPTNVTLVSYRDKTLNVPRIVFAAIDKLKSAFDEEVTALNRALSRDVEIAIVERVSVSYAWENDKIITTLSIAGEAKNVLTLLNQLPKVVDPTEPASEWIEQLSEIVKTISRPSYSTVSWSGVDYGRLTIPRHGEVTFNIEPPTAIREFFDSVTINADESG